MSTREPRVRPRTRGHLARRGGVHDPTAPVPGGGAYDPTAAAPGGTAPASAARRGSGPPPTPPPDWRSEIAGLSGLNVLAGIWLIIAPWVLGYSTSDPRWNDVVFGIIVGIFALTRVSRAYRAEWLSLLNALIGTWLFVAAFTIDHTAVAMWNDIILGIIVFLLAIGSAEATANLFPRRQGAPPRMP